MINLKEKFCLIIGCGIEIEHAARLAHDFGKVYYWSYFLGEDGCPKYELYSIGKEFDGVIRIADPFEVIDKVDLICFFYVGWGSWADSLRKQGKRVFGGGRAEILEQDRYFMRKKQAEIGLPVQNTIVANGITELREYLKEEDNAKGRFIIKIDRFRGNIESFDSQYSASILKDLEEQFGPDSEDFKFMIEEKIEDAIEIGFDGIFNGSKFLSPIAYGVEYKSSYIGKFSDKLPSILQNTQDKIAPVMKSYGYRGAMSNEVRIGKDKKPYWIDATIRDPYPLSNCYTEMIENYSEVVWKTAGGEDVKPEVGKDKYFGICPIISYYSENHWTEINLKPEDKKFIKLEYARKKGNQYYGVKGFTDVIHIIASGNSPQQVKDRIKENISKVSCHELQTQGVGSFDVIMKEIEQAKKLGIDI